MEFDLEMKHGGVAALKLSVVNRVHVSAHYTLP